MNTPKTEYPDMAQAIILMLGLKNAPENARNLKKIIKEIGWPTCSKVGEEASRGAWQIALAADHDVAFQEHCLHLMYGCSVPEVQLLNIAMLEDRICVNRRRPQRFGTQFINTGTRYIPYAILRPEKVDERRMRMGLDTLENGMRRMNEANPIKPA